MDTLTTALAAVIFVAGAIVLLGVVLFLIKQASRFALAIVANSIIGLIALALLRLIGVNVPFTLPVILSIALFGLGGVGTLLVLIFSGVKVG
jgi:hypothetical protein